MSQAPIFIGSVWRWQGFRCIELPNKSRGDGAKATAASEATSSVDVASVSDQAKADVGPPSR